MACETTVLYLLINAHLLSAASARALDSEVGGARFRLEHGHCQSYTFTTCACCNDTSKEIQKAKWQAYVDDALLRTGQVSQAAIFGLEGTLWAASRDFQVGRHIILL